MAMRAFFCLFVTNIGELLYALCYQVPGLCSQSGIQNRLNNNELVLFLSLSGRVGGHMFRWIIYSSCQSLHQTT